MSDQSTVTITLLAAEGSVIEEPNAAIRFLTIDDQMIGGAPHVAFPPTRTFTMTAWPTVNVAYCDITLSRFYPLKSQFFVPEADAIKQLTANAIRDPDCWTPTFTSLVNLVGPRFARLQAVLTASKAAGIKQGAAIGDLADNYDGLAGDQAILAKMALLNLYAVASDEQDPLRNVAWFDAVGEILLIDRERFVGTAQKALYDSVVTIEKNIAQYRARGFFTEASTGLHVDNIPQGYTLNEMHSVKVRYQQGNLQLTVADTTLGGNTVYLLDCDMDEHSNTLFHTVDIIDHLVTGGTNPIDMHEYIMRDSISEEEVPVDLGYTLNPTT